MEVKYSGTRQKGIKKGGEMAKYYIKNSRDKVFVDTERGEGSGGRENDGEKKWNKVTVGVLS